LIYFSFFAAALQSFKKLSMGKPELDVKFRLLFNLAMNDEKAL